MGYVFNLSDRRAGDITHVGGKAANLHRLLRLGFSVPPGLVVSAGALELFLKTNKLYKILEEELSEVNKFNLVQIQDASDRIRDAVLQGEVPPDLLEDINARLSEIEGKSFAVRSSGGFEDSPTASWAGQFDSFLSVGRGEVREHLQACWASLFGWRAIQYHPGRFEDIRSLRFAVIIQRLVEAKVSGVAFSLDPGSGDTGRVLIEAIAGLGDRLVQGREIPFSATMDKEQGIILRTSTPAGKRPDLLGPAQLRELSDLTCRIENSLGGPVDIEWSIDAKGTHVLQARPITSLRSARTETLQTDDGPNILDYELTFKVSGLSFLFCDMLARGFKYLRPLFMSNDQDFQQYFPNERMEYAAREGYRWLSRSDGFTRYRSRFDRYQEDAKRELSRILSGSVLSASESQRAFRLMAGLLRYYSRMDFQFTNLTFLYIEENQVIRENLEALAQFKDHARTWVNDIVIEDDSFMAKLIERLAQQLGLSEELVQLHKISELQQSFGTVRVPDSVLRERAESYTIFVRHGRFHYLQGEESRRFIRRATEAEERMVAARLTGQVANGEGTVVRGRVRIINVDYGDLDTMNRKIQEMVEDEILVAEFTAPELMMACRKAAAIVTDLGGMLSHAAIVSRELGIPCVVGTKHATRSFNNGDMVEVDLGKGTIRRLGGD